MDSLPSLPPITRLSPRVIRILGHNPGKFTLQGTNTYLIGTGRDRILLDTGEGKPEWRESLKEALEGKFSDAGESDGESGGLRIKEVLLSHWHGDHVGGMEDVRSLAASGKKGEEATAVKFWKKDSADWGEKDCDEISSGQVFRVPGAMLTAIHTPGHTSDHVAFVLEEEKALFTADAVLGHGTAVFENLAEYLASLRAMLGLEREVFDGRAYPGHGEVVEDGRGKIEEYVRHRAQREEEVLRVLERGGGWGSMEIVKVMYREYPEALHGPAEGGVRLILGKLDGEGRVKKGEDGKWELSGGKAAAL